MRSLARAAARPDMSEIPALILYAWLCWLAFRYGRRVRVRVKTSISTSADYGYDEALGTQTSSLSSAGFLANCPDDGPTIADASKDGSEKLWASAIVAQGARSLTAKFRARATGGHHVE